MFFLWVLLGCSGTGEHEEREHANHEKAEHGAGEHGKMHGKHGAEGHGHGDGHGKHGAEGHGHGGEHGKHGAGEHGEHAHGEGHAHGHGPAKAPVVDGWAHYGAPFSLETAVDCAEVIRNPQASLGKTIRVRGKIENVCQKAGCWMVLADGEGNYLRVAMKDHDNGVPTDTKTGEGTLADVEGTLVEKPLDEKTIAHLKAEAKGDAAALEKQFAPRYELVATGVSIKEG